ncbi:MAG: polyphosphate kinase 2 [Hyphomicrobiaceae bacterium]
MAKAEKSAPKSEPKATLKISGPYKGFDIEDSKLPKAIDDGAYASGGYPHDKKLKREDFETELQALQIELLKLQAHIQKAKERVVVVFEGRDAAGKGTCIGRMREHLNPRHAHVVALTKPTETERGQWYFQRYAVHLPSAGEIVLFDRSWYNRAGVERVMSFCSPDQLADFLREAPEFEGLLVRDGIHVIKIYLEIGRAMQLKRFHERRHDPLKRWKITDIDLAAMAKWDEYTQAKEEMFRFTHTAVAPWTVILSNDQRRARLESIRLLLTRMDYAGKDSTVVGACDAKIVGAGPDFFVRSE